MDRKRIEQQISNGLQRILQSHVGEPQSNASNDPVRASIKIAVEGYIAKMFHFGMPSLDEDGEWRDNPLPVTFVSTTTPEQVKQGYMAFEFRDRATGKRIESSDELMRLLGMP